MKKKIFGVILYILLFSCGLGLLTKGLFYQPFMAGFVVGLGLCATVLVIMGSFALIHWFFKDE